MIEENRRPPPDRWERVVRDERRRQWRRDGFLILSFILIIFGYLYLVSRSTRGDPEISRVRTEMTSNLRQLGLALLEFEIEYGKFPDASTIDEVKKNSGTSLTLNDSSSNDLFRQLLSGKIVQSERMFRVYGRTSKLPDEHFDNDTNALAAGECGVAYVVGPPSVQGSPRPIAFGPVKPGTRSIDSELMKGVVMVLFTDLTVQWFHLDAKGVISIPANPFDPSRPVWNGKPLEIKWPK